MVVTLRYGHGISDISLIRICSCTEHQSTYNPNMPLRDLFYIASEYQKLVDKKSLYSSKLQKIPAPKFLVFYNGTEEMEDSRTEYLSVCI